MASAKKVKKGSAAAAPDFDKRNYIILGVGVLLIILGFVFLAGGDITISPILLVLGYCIIIPLGILLPKGKDESTPLDADKRSAVSP
jgi:xanthine/uracil permease